MTTTPSPRPQGARHAGSWLAAGLGAAAVAVGVAVGRRIVPGRKRGAVAGGPPPTRLPPPTERPGAGGTGAADLRPGAADPPPASVPAPGRSGSGAGRIGPETIPGYTGLGATLPSDEQLAAWAGERGSVTSERPELPRRQPGAELPESRPRPDGVAGRADGAPDPPDPPDLPLGFLSELHERFRADVEQQSGEVPASPAGDAAPWAGGELVGRIKDAGRRPGGRDANGASSAPANGGDGSGRTGAAASSDLLDADVAVPGVTSDRLGTGPLPDGEQPVPPAGAGRSCSPAGGEQPAPASDAGQPGPLPDGGQAVPPAGAGRSGPPPAGGPLRNRRLLGAILAVVMVVVFLAGVAVIRSGGGEEAETADAPRGDAAPVDSTDDGLPATSTPPPPPQQAFTQAAETLLEGGSFAYTGAAHATDVSRVRPGLWLAVDVVIAGEVDLAAGRVHETAVALGGSTSETVVDGANVWGRTAPGVEGLAEQDYQAIPELSIEPPVPMGAGLLPTWLALATNPQPAGPDLEGRPTYRATLPAAALGEAGGPPADAEIALTLGNDGEPAGVRVTVLPDGAALQVVLEVSDVGDPVTIDAPG